MQAIVCQLFLSIVPLMKLRIYYQIKKFPVYCAYILMYETFRIELHMAAAKIFVL